MERVFKANDLREKGLPYGGGNDCAIISVRIVGKRRWSIDHELIFQFADQPKDEAWRVYYSTGATEMQSERAWGYESDNEDVAATLVVARERTVKIWEPAE